MAASLTPSTGPERLCVCLEKQGLVKREGPIQAVPPVDRASAAPVNLAA